MSRSGVLVRARISDRAFAELYPKAYRKRPMSLPPALEAQRRNLLGHEADEKNHDAQQNEQHRRVRHMRLRESGPHSVRSAHEKGRGADRKKDSQRAEDRDHLEKNQQETDAVGAQAN